MTDLSRLDFLYLTTTGRISGQPREIEIWFVNVEKNFYVIAEHFHRAQWVKNIVVDNRVQVRLGDLIFSATARVLDENNDSGLWQQVRELSRQKYGWGEGLPVEIVPH